MSAAAGDPAPTGGVGRAGLAALIVGTVLNPLNSSMVSVALVLFARDFGVGTGAVTWVVSAFYLAGCVGQPLMGRFADRFGPRRVFGAGMVLVLATAVLAPFSPGFEVLVGLRVLQSLGTSVAFPAAVAVLRRHGGAAQGSGPTSIATANTVGAAVGPVLGGVLVEFFGWEGVFWVNVPLAVLAFVTARAFVPADPPAERISARALFRGADPVGVLGFTTALVGFLVFALSLSGAPAWWALPLVVVGAALFLWWERRTGEPFVDVRLLVARPALLGTYAQFVVFNLVFYSAFYGLPEWLESSRGFPAGESGLLVLPLAGVGAVVTVLASRVITRIGVGRTLLVGFAVLVLGCAGVLALSGTTPLAVVVLVGGLLGIPYGLNNLGLQARMYALAPPESSGVAAGLFQTSRYVGAILSTSVLGVVFASSIDDARLHQVGWVMVVLAAGLVATGLLGLRPRAAGDR